MGGIGWDFQTQRAGLAEGSRDADVATLEVPAYAEQALAWPPAVLGGAWWGVSLESQALYILLKRLHFPPGATEGVVPRLRCTLESPGQL